jgi:hypothetical protein
VISAAFPYKKQRRRVLGREMAYVEIGKGDPIVLLHGNPRWRRPPLQPDRRQVGPACCAACATTRMSRPPQVGCSLGEPAAPATDL